MARSKGPQIQEDVSPNLIPMVDIMFLLLLFFMLGADMGQRELEDVRLPQAVSIKEDKDTKEKERDRITINIYHRYKNEIKCALYDAHQVCREDGHWRVGIKGRDFTDPEKLGGMLKLEADKKKSTDPKTPEASERKVMIRADSSAPFGLVQKAMNICARAGIWKIDCGAARPEETGKKKS